MLVQRRDELLARADPFDLAQAVDRYVHTLRGGRIRTLMLDACERIGQYYRAEFVQLLTGTPGVGDAEQLAQTLKRKWSDAELQAAFARLLKTNLRAIPMFGGAFCDEVLAYVPTDRAVGIGEERNPLPRAVIFAGVAAALVIGGAAGERYYANARVQAATPATVVAPVTITTTPSPAKQRVIAVSTPVPIPSRTTVPAPTASPTQAPAAAPTQATTPAPTQAPTAIPAVHRPRQPRPTPPPARGVATVVIPDPTPSPEPSALDTTDMPDSYTDATPLPQVTAPPAEVPGRVHLVTPTPKPVHHGWVHNSIMHLDPFKPHPRSTP